jgi:hypothetical protein
VTVAKAYRLLHAILETAAEDDRIIPRNPCHIDGAGKEESDERQIVPLPVVFEIAKAVPVRYRALVLLATFALCDGVNWSGFGARTLTWRRAKSGSRKHSPSSTRAGCAPTRQSRVGKRTVAFPASSPRRSFGTWSG